MRLTYVQNNIERDTQALAGYVVAPATGASAAVRRRYRKKIIAETIGSLYKGRGGFGSAAAQRLAKHVDEGARQDFLRTYGDEVTRLQQRIETRRLDRLAWLATWNQREQPNQLGSAWSAFDFDSAADSAFFELTFAGAIAGMGGYATANSGQDGAQQQELALIGKWLNTPVDQSPLYLAVFGYEPLRQALATAPDRAGNLAEGLGSLAEQLYEKFPYTIGTETVTHAVTAYVLNKPGKWRPAMAKSLDALLEQVVGSRNVKLLAEALQIRYRQFVTAAVRSSAEYKRLFIEAAGAKPPVGSAAVGTPIKSGHLENDGYTTFEIAEERVSERQPLFGEGVANPFRGLAGVGVSAFAGLLYLINLKMAVEQFDPHETEQWTNMASAVAAIGGGINSGLNAFKVSAPAAVSRLSEAVPLIESLSGKLAYRLFGYGAAFLTGVTLGIHAGKLFEQGETDAGLYYAGAAMAGSIGASGLTFAIEAEAGATLLSIGPIGWAILGVVLVGASIALESEGDDAVDTPLEHWLDACTFGKHALPNAPHYDTLDDELNALDKALYMPRVVSSD